MSNNLEKPIKRTNGFSLNDQQRKVWEGLTKISDRLGQLYIGSLRVLADKKNPARFVLAAHALRAMSWKDRDGKDETEIEDGKKEEKHRERVKKQIINTDPLGGAPDYILEEISGRWVKDLHGWFNKISKGFVDVSQKEFERKLSEFEKILFSISNPHFEIINNIDSLLLIKKPSKDDVLYLKTLLTSWSAYAYFFEKAEDNWFNPLLNAGFFKKPPVQQNWPESRYLVKIAPKNPKKVMVVIKDCSITKNPSIHDDFLQAAMNMPVKIGKEIFGLLQKNHWLESRYHIFLPHKLAEFMKKLTNNGNLKPALLIARILIDVSADKPKRIKGIKGPLSIIHPDAKPIFGDEWLYRRIITEDMEEIKKKEPKKIFLTFCSKLEKALELEERGGKNAKNFYEYSHIWRPSITQPRTLTHEDVKNALMDGIISIINPIEGNELNRSRTIADTLKSFKHPIFRRVELYLYKKFPGQFKNDINRILTDKRAIRAHNLKREYIPLLEEQFQNLKKESQDKILKEIRSGFGMKRDKKWPVKKFNFTVANHQLLYLQPLAGKLPKDYDKLYKDLLKKYGKAYDDDGGIKSFTGPTSPITLDDLSQKDPGEIINYLISWVPPKDKFGEPSTEGLGRLFQQIVLDKSLEFSKLAPILFQKRLRPVYIYHLFYGLKDALRQNKCFEWEPVVDLCILIINVKDYSEFPKTSDDFEPDWRAVKKSMIDLIGDGFSSKDCNIPYTLREKIWSIIEFVSNDEDPTPEHEKKYGGENMDPATMSINTTRGEALHAVIKYALWCSQNLYPNPEEALKIKSKLVTEAKSTLEKHLDVKIDPAVSIRAIYGWYLPNLFYLDKEWLIKNLNNIFPENQKEQEFFWAAWETFLSNSVYHDLFPIVKEKYRFAISLLGKNSGKKHRYANLDELLPHHFMIIYANDLGNSDDLIKDFFEKAPNEALGVAHSFTGRAILKKELSKIPDDKTVVKIEKLKKLWEERLNIPKEKQGKEEFKEFGWWFERSPFERKWTIDMMARTVEITEGEIEPEYEIPKTLLSYVDEFPYQTINILYLIAKGDKTNWRIQSSGGEYKEIIQRTMKNKNEKAKKIAVDLINYLGKRGYLEYRDLL